MPAGTTFYADTSAQPGVAYVYEVSAFNGVGKSGESITGNADAPTDPGLSDDPDPSVAWKAGACGD